MAESERPWLDALCEEYKFKVQSSEPGIDFFVFEDGRKYKLQHPPFLQVHALLMDDHADHLVFLLGLENLYPDSKDAPAIDEEYLGRNRREAVELWSPLIRGLLSGS